MAKMTIGKRLTIGFGVMLYVALGLAGSGIFWIGRLGMPRTPAWRPR